MCTQVRVLLSTHTSAHTGYTRAHVHKHKHHAHVREHAQDMQRYIHRQCTPSTHAECMHRCAHSCVHTSTGTHKPSISAISVTILPSVIGILQVLYQTHHDPASEGPQPAVPSSHTQREGVAQQGRTETHAPDAAGTGSCTASLSYLSCLHHSLPTPQIRLPPMDLPPHGSLHPTRWAGLEFRAAPAPPDLSISLRLLWIAQLWQGFCLNIYSLEMRNQKDSSRTYCFHMH